MFCNNCGKELNNDEVICLACGADTSNQWYEEDENAFDTTISDDTVDNTIDDSANAAISKTSVIVRKVKRYIILAIIVVCLWGWYGTDSGRLTTARILVAFRCYPTAYNIALKVPTAEGVAFQQYTSILRQINYLCNSSRDNLESTTQNIKYIISSIDSNQYLLKDYEISTLFDIENCLNETESLGYSIMSDFTTACKIYDRLEYYDSGKSWFAKDELNTAKECKEAIERIIENSNTLDCALSEYAQEIQIPIDYIINDMQDDIDNNNTGSRYYIDSSFTQKYPNNYDSTRVKSIIDTNIASELEDCLY